MPYTTHSTMPKVQLVLSETPGRLSSGGSVAAHEHAALMADLAPTRIVYVDWKSEGRILLDQTGQHLCHPVSIEKRPGGMALGFRVRRRLTEKFGSLMHRGPWFYGSFSQAQVKAQMQRYLAEFKPDVVAFDGIPSTIAWDSCAGYQRLYFAFNVESDIVEFSFPQGWLRKLERQRMRKHEARILREADLVVCFTKRDYDSLRCIAPDGNYQVIPPAYAAPAPKLPLAPMPWRDRYVIIPSNAAWKPNRLSLSWFVDKVLPHVADEIQFRITGKDEKDFFAGLAATHSNLHYLGLLDREQYEQVFRGASLLVNPTRHGSGFQIKLMEALRFDIPVVSSQFSNHLGALLSATDDPQRMAAMINEWMLKETGIKRLDYAALHQRTRQRMQVVLQGFSRLPSVAREPRANSGPAQSAYGRTVLAFRQRLAGE